MMSDQKQDEKMFSEIIKIIERARLYFNGKWPAQLTSGVMFFEGVRITKEDFQRKKKNS